MEKYTSINFLLVFFPINHIKFVCCPSQKNKNRSLDEPPSSLPAFSGREKRTTPIAGLTTAVAEIAKACVMAQQSSQQCGGSTVSATVPSTSTSSSVSPAKVVDLRRNYLEQVKDLHSLLECGALTEAEFEEQKDQFWSS